MAPRVVLIGSEFEENLSLRYVTGGELDASAAQRVQWTLPTRPGIYQAEVLLDYGADGIAFDTLMLEVTSGE